MDRKEFVQAVAKEAGLMRAKGPERDAALIDATLRATQDLFGDEMMYSGQDVKEMIGFLLPAKEHQE